MLRPVILAASRNSRVAHLVENAPGSRAVVSRFVAGNGLADALLTTRGLVDAGLSVTLDRLGEDVTDATEAQATVRDYVELLAGLAEEGLAAHAEVSVKLSALGQRLDPRLATDNAAEVCRAAADAGTTVTLDMEDHTTTDTTLATLAELRRDFPGTGAVLQAYLRRTEADCRELATAGSRVRLCKGAYSEPESVAFASGLEVDRSYVRCVNTLLAGDGYPMFATHDPRMIAIIEERVRWYERDPSSFELQMLHGIRPEEQTRLAAAGYTTRVYLPYGSEWYAYLMRRVAERPAYVGFFLRALTSRR